jgi:hypothetical protein
MRTTLTLEPDVAALLARIRKQSRRALKDVVNEALRRGLRELSAPPPRGAGYRTTPVSLGRCLVGSLDDVAEALAAGEGEAFR